MPIRYWISESEDLTYAQWTGSVTVAEMRANFENYLADPLYVAGRTELIDLLGVKSIDIGIKTMLPLLSMVNEQSFAPQGGTKTVIVTQRKVIFGIARMYQMLAGNQNGICVHVFDNEADALSALGRGEDDLSSLLETLRHTTQDPSTGSAT